MTEDFLAFALNAERRSHACEDADYPQFHVAPPVGRLNDPNGLIKVGDTYHAFFQYTPEHPKKLVYWGHATSKNLVNWEYLKPAILPDSHQDANGAYSGTAIATEEGVELWYTGNYKDPQTGEREATQCVVTTPDMKSFTKLVPPIIGHQPNGYTAHFRDPQVWADPEVPGSYRMLLGVQRENETGAALLYRSSNLRTWECEGEMTFPDANGAFDAFGYMWECPTLVRLSDESATSSSSVPRASPPTSKATKTSSPAFTSSENWSAQNLPSVTDHLPSLTAVSSSTLPRSTRVLTLRGVHGVTRSPRFLSAGPATPAKMTSPRSKPEGGCTA